MKKLILLAVVLVGAATASQAGVRFGFGLGIPLGPPAPVVVSPPVVYTAPAPVYTTPAPVISQGPVYTAPPAVVYQAPAPVVVSPPPVVCAPSPSVVIGFGGYGWYPRHGYYHGYWRGHGWHR